MSILYDVVHMNVLPIWSAVLPILVSIIYATYNIIQRCFFIGKYKNYRQLPPGPPSNPFTGTPGYPTGKHHLFFKKLSDQYGEIFSVWAGPTLQIVLNSPRLIRTLCDKRGAIYNDRPKMYAFHDCIFRGISIVSTGYNELWRKQRKIFSSMTNVSASKNFLPYQDYESKQYINDLLDSPEHFFMHTERFGTSILTSTVFGLRADDIADPAALGLILAGTWLEANFVPGKYLDDRWPVLQRIPRVLAPWRKQYDENSKLLNLIARSWWDPAKLGVQKGHETPCFVTGFLKSYAQEGFTEDEAALVALGLMLAGAGTTGAIQNFLIMGCALNPDVVEKAHEELDRVVGNSRLPTVSDEPALPYVRAIIKETLRWRPFSNQGFYHATTKDDWVDGYYIPKGTTIVANAYSIHMDEKRHQDPEKFNPTRYINHNLSAHEYANLNDPEKRDHFAYGAGRRICAGLPVAEVSLFLLASRLLWGFHIGPKKDENGTPLPIDPMGYEEGIFGKPKLFNAEIRCRSSNHASIIRNEFQNAHTDVKSLGEATKLGRMPGMQQVVEILKEHPDVASHAHIG